jgi:Rrf2 family transcriptional regulator, iron-sulfur cluster assembly transcription factor
MRLEMGRRADYGIRAAIDLARHHDTGVRRKARQIAETMDVPTTYVPQVLADLVRAELAVSLAGPSGGYLLARPPEEVSLLAIILAVDDDPVSRVCVLRGGPCHWEDSCAVHVLWSDAQQAMLDRLEQATLAEVLAYDAAIEGGAQPRLDRLVEPAFRPVVTDDTDPLPGAAAVAAPR